MSPSLSGNEGYIYEHNGWAKTKLALKTVFSIYPPLLNVVLRVWTSAKWNVFKLKLKTLTLINRQDRFLDIDKTLWVSPQKIIFCSKTGFDLDHFKGEVIPGDWDSLTEKIEGGNPRAGSRPGGSVIPTSKESVKAGEEVVVSIGRYGDLFLSNHADRLAAARLQQTESIPIQIAVRHPEWMKLRAELLFYAKNSKEWNGRLYQPILHPDLADIPALHACEVRFVRIKSHLTAKSGSLLDIGANLGYFCHRFEDEGFQCYASENSTKELYFLERLKRAENKAFRILGESILECEFINGKYFDVVLALNVFHHFLKTKESHGKFVSLLKRLQVGEMYFEPHLYDEPQMQHAYANYSNEEFVNFVLENTSLTRAEFLGKDSDGRSIFKLY